MKNLFKDCVYKKHPLDPNGPYAKFPAEYLREFRRKSGGRLKYFMSSIMESYGSSINRAGFFYLNSWTVDFILGEIRFFKKHGRFRECE